MPLIYSQEQQLYQNIKQKIPQPNPNPKTQQNFLRKK